MLFNKFIYPIFIIDSNNKPTDYCGTGFLITPDGGLITCKHVVDKKISAFEKLAIRDDEKDVFIPVGEIRTSSIPFDLVFLPNAIPTNAGEFLPILNPSKLFIGEDAITIGKYAVGGLVTAVDKGYFRGNIVNIYKNPNMASRWTLMLPYPVIEGLSGSPVHTYHNGTKLIGICYGSESQRILASEVVEFKEKDKVLEEKIHRIVEFGLAYHAAEVIAFLNNLSVKNFVVSEENVAVPNLD